MRSINFSIGLTAALVALAVFGTTTRAVAQKEKPLHSFNNNGRDGYTPWANLIFDSSGNLYGTTAGGGAFSYGTVFELSPSASGGWTEKVLHNFDDNGRDGQNPYAGLIFDAVGNLFGTTTYGGSHNGGTVFELMPAAGGRWTEKILHSFDNDAADGFYPYAGLIFDASGNLYGTTFTGGAHGGNGQGGGTVFELLPGAGGIWTEKILHNFDDNGTDGFAPCAGLVLDASGNLYGTTPYGGAHGSTVTGGTAFELRPEAGGGWSEKILHNFNESGTDANQPFAGLVLDASGNLYGTAIDGGEQDDGAVFELTPTAGGIWTEKILHSFTGEITDGYFPFAALIFDSAGNLYSTTGPGGIYGGGSVFKLAPTAGGGWTETLLHSFGQGEDGLGPEAGLIHDATGNLYGTTEAGGSSTGCVYGCGTIFEIKP